MAKKPPAPLSESAVRALVDSLVVKAGSMRTLAAEWGMSPSYLSDFLNGRRGPGPQILKPLGLVQVVTVAYVKGETEGRRRQSKTKRTAGGT